MPGDSLMKDLTEVAEYWGEPERLGIPAWEIARYWTTSLVALTDALRAVLTVEEGTSPNAEYVPDGKAVSVGAQSLFPERVGSDDPEG